MLRRPADARPSISWRSQFSNIFSETAWPIKAKCYVEPPWIGGTKVCPRHLGHMTKMASTPIYSKNPSKIFFSRNSGPISTKLVCSIWDSSPVLEKTEDSRFWTDLEIVELIYFASNVILSVRNKCTF